MQISLYAIARTWRKLSQISKFSTVNLVELLKVIHDWAINVFMEQFIYKQCDRGTAFWF